MRFTAILSFGLLLWIRPADACSDGVDFDDTQVWPESTGGEGEAPDDAVLQAGEAPTLIFEGHFGVGGFRRGVAGDFTLARVDGVTEEPIPFDLVTVEPPQGTSTVALSPTVVSTGQIRLLMLSGSTLAQAPSRYHYATLLVPEAPPAPGDRLRVRYTVTGGETTTEHQQDFIVVPPGETPPGPELVHLGEQVACANRSVWCTCAHQNLRWPALRQDMAVTSLQPLSGQPTLVTLNLTDGAGEALAEHRIVLVPVPGQDSARINLQWSPEWQAQPGCKVCLTVTRSVVGDDEAQSGPPLCFATHQLADPSAPDCPHNAGAECGDPKPPEGYEPPWIACSADGEPVVEPSPDPESNQTEVDAAEVEPAVVEPTVVEPDDSADAGASATPPGDASAAMDPTPAPAGGCQHGGRSSGPQALLLLTLVLLPLLRWARGADGAPSS